MRMPHHTVGASLSLTGVPLKIYYAPIGLVKSAQFVVQTEAVDRPRVSYQRPHPTIPDISGTLGKEIIRYTQLFIRRRPGCG
jgi:hypothetical protein